MNHQLHCQFIRRLCQSCDVSSAAHCTVLHHGVITSSLDKCFPWFLSIAHSFHLLRHHSFVNWARMTSIPQCKHCKHTTKELLESLWAPQNWQLANTDLPVATESTALSFSLFLLSVSAAVRTAFPKCSLTKWGRSERQCARWSIACDSWVCNVRTVIKGEGKFKTDLTRCPQNEGAIVCSQWSAQKVLKGAVWQFRTERSRHRENE